MTQKLPFLNKDIIHAETEIKPGIRLLELRAGPKAHQSRWLLVNDDGYTLGEVKRPRYGHRHLEAYSGTDYYNRITFKMDAPALAENVLVDELKRFAEKFC